MHPPAPANLRKAVPPYDPPVATGPLLASEQAQGCVERALFLGEPRVDGALDHTDAMLPIISIAQRQAAARYTKPLQGYVKVVIVKRH